MERRGASRARRAACALFGALLAASCGIDVVGDAASPDAGSPASDDGGAPASSDADKSTTCLSVEPGWTPIAYAPSRDVSCPPGYTATDLLSEPSAGSGACTCACKISPSDPPSCARGELSGFSGSSSCDGQTPKYPINGTGCTALASSAITTSVARYTPLPLHRGTCLSSVVANEAALVSVGVRACAPPPTDAGQLCAGSAPSGFTSCVAHDGDVACPAGPFVARTVAVARAALRCGGCEGCQVTATCPPSVTLRYYNSSSCTSEVARRVINGNCNGLSAGTSGAPYSHFRYEAEPTNVGCASTSSPTTAVDVEGAQTICCLP